MAKRWIRMALAFMIGVAACGCTRTHVIRITLPDPVAARHFETANECYINQEYDRALESYLEVMDIYEAIGYPDDMLRGDLYYMVGVCHSHLGDEGAAMRYYEDSLEVCASSGNRGTRLLNYHQMMVVGQRLRSIPLDDLLDLGKAAEDLAVEIYGGRPKWLVTVYIDIGDLYRVRSDLDNAYCYYDEALRLHHGFYAGDETLESARLSISMAALYGARGQHGVQEAYLIKAERAFTERDNPEGLSEAWAGLGALYQSQGKYGKAVGYLDQAIAYHEDKGAKVRAAPICYYRKSIALYEMGRLDGFLEFGAKAYRSGKARMEMGLRDEVPWLVRISMGLYYGRDFDGDKSHGFDAWFEEQMGKPDGGHEAASSAKGGAYDKSAGTDYRSAGI